MQDETVTVWGKPDCPKCWALTRKFDKAGVQYEYRNYLDESPDRQQQLRALADGAKALPIVVTSTHGSWGDLHMPKVEALIADITGATKAPRPAPVAPAPNHPAQLPQPPHTSPTGPR